MSQIVIDTDVASYIFNWHSLAQQWVDVLRGSELFPESRPRQKEIKRAAESLGSQRAEIPV